MQRVEVPAHAESGSPCPCRHWKSLPMQTVEVPAHADSGSPCPCRQWKSLPMQTVEIPAHAEWKSLPMQRVEVPAHAHSGSPCPCRNCSQWLPTEKVQRGPVSLLYLQVPLMTRASLGQLAALWATTGSHACVFLAFD